MPGLPCGTVTFLLTDIEGSTQLWERCPEEMRSILSRHDELVERTVEGRGGALVRTRGEGDSRFAVFSTATDAVAAAADLQAALLSEPWPSGVALRVRMAVHTGEAELRDDDYYGAAVNRCARLRSVGHGGQVLLSQATYELARDSLPESLGFRDLGVHRLKDIQQPERVFQLVAPGLPLTFPPLRSPGGVMSNLPEPLTSFVGREKELGRVQRLLSATRLLTLTGSGGVGKTRLALRAAEAAADDGDTVWLVPLSHVTDPAQVPRNVVVAMGLVAEGDQPLTQVLASAVGARKVLLVLDDCERVLTGCAELAESLLRLCPGLRVLATSRERLGVAGETVYRIPTLSVPLEDDVEDLGEVLRYDAVRLFVDRATAAQPGFSLSEQSAPIVVQVCRRLDGIPLAIELAAARVRALPIEQIARRLDDRFRLLTGGSRTALPRQQTLRALIDWSYDLLTEAERVLLCRISVFAGGWTLEAAERIAAGGLVDAYDVLDYLTQLVDKSLVMYEGPDQPEARYRLLETVRQYGLERLDQLGEAPEVRRRHRDYYVAYAEAASARLRGPDEAEGFEDLEEEHDNLRAAFEECLSDPEAGEDALRLANALARYWEVRGHWSEGRERLAAALAHPGAAAYSRPRVAALWSAGWLACRQEDREEARRYYGECLSTAEGAGDRPGVARALNGLGLVAVEEGRLEEARGMYEQSLAIRRELGDGPGVAVTTHDLGAVAYRMGDLDTARRLFQEALYLDTAAGHRGGDALLNLARVDVREGRWEEARSRLEECLRCYGELGYRPNIARSLEALACVEVAEGRPDRAARLLGAADSLWEEIRAPGTADEERSACRRAVVDALGEERFQRESVSGRGMSLEQSVAFALSGGMRRRSAETVRVA